MRHQGLLRPIFLHGKWGILCEMNQVSHHSDWDFNETQCIGLFHPKNKLVSVKIPYAKNFAKKPPLKSEQTFSILAITWSWNIENIHMYSDITLEKDALSCGIIHFSFKLTKKILNFKNPPAPPLDIFFQNFYFPPKKLHLFIKLSIKKISGTSSPSVLKIKFSF